MVGHGAVRAFCSRPPCVTSPRTRDARCPTPAAPAAGAGGARNFTRIHTLFYFYAFDFQKRVNFVHSLSSWTFCFLYMILCSITMLHFCTKVDTYHNIIIINIFFYLCLLLFTFVIYCTYYELFYIHKSYIQSWVYWVKQFMVVSLQCDSESIFHFGGIKLFKSLIKQHNTYVLRVILIHRR